MSIWDRPLRTYFEDAESLAQPAIRSRATKWLAGVALAGLPIGYGIRSILTEQSTLFGSQGMRLHVEGEAAILLGAAYLAVGASAHFHWFWGLHRRLEPYSEAGKLLSVLIFLPCFAYGILKALTS